MNRSYCALYIDAGYLLAAMATRVTGTSLRSGIEVNAGALVNRLIQEAEAISGLPLLRAHWYDASQESRPTSEQDRIGMLPRVKLRLGRTRNGVQKGVDLRLGLDIVNHARNRAVDVMILVSGDDDLTEAVEEAQALGAQVILLAVPTQDGRPDSVAHHLHRAADDLHVLDDSAIEAAVTRATRPARPVPQTVAIDSVDRPGGPVTPAIMARRVSDSAAQPGNLVASSSTNGETRLSAAYLDAEEIDEAVDAVCHRVISTWSRTASIDDRQALEAARPNIPRELDRALLMDTSAALSIPDLDDRIRATLRRHFWVVLDKDGGS